MMQHIVFMVLCFESSYHYGGRYMEDVRALVCAYMYAVVELFRHVYDICLLRPMHIAL